MSPFGHKDDDKREMLAQWRVATQAEFERLNGQANVNAGPTAQAISYAFAPERAFTFPVPTPEDVELRDRIAKLVAEGLQELEHASLVRCQMHTAMGYLDWTATRRGRAALERSEVQRLLQR